MNVKHCANPLWRIMEMCKFLLFAACLLPVIACSSDDDDDNGGAGAREAVDLGLSVKWASCNVGASSPEQYGNYFAWGETVAKSSFTRKNYKYYDEKGDAMTKYPEVGVNTQFELTSSDDAATVNWGAGWRMPTFEEVRELYDKCTFTRTQMNGVYGSLVTGPNGNSIFLPAAGVKSGVEYFISLGAGVYYWTSSLYFLGYEDVAAYVLDGNNNSQSHTVYERTFGMPVRPVCD